MNYLDCFATLVMTGLAFYQGVAVLRYASPAMTASYATSSMTKLPR